ncbi:type II toxin-antitoxin system PemK/MazF family toxin [Candidatus Pacearchaeota archaeon]|nr:type II toxin-antitoxin system PemK/MazF family toxin [Candidatus Pacearchaeota archaeon]
MKKGEIWIIDFPLRGGKEQAGTRPSVIMGDTGTNLVLVVPLTSNLQALNKLPHTLRVDKSKDNKLDKDSVALVLQLQALDKKRFISKIGNLEEFHLKKIDEEIRELLRL